MVNAPHFIAVVRAGATFVNGSSSNGPTIKINKEGVGQAA